MSVPPLKLVRQYGESNARETRQHRGQRDIALGFGQWSTDTAVDAVPESEVAGSVPSRIELAR